MELPIHKLMTLIEYSDDLTAEEQMRLEEIIEDLNKLCLEVFNR